MRTTMVRTTVNDDDDNNKNDQGKPQWQKQVQATIIIYKEIQKNNQPQAPINSKRNTKQHSTTN
jgi:hypothetical protein